jgi:gamma-glutamyltranspeptidase
MHSYLPADWLTCTHICLLTGLHALISACTLHCLHTGGEVVNNPALAETLRQIALDPEYLHNTMAATLAAEIQAAGGIITAAEITAYTPKLREAVEYEIFGHQVLSSPPPSSGGLIVVASLQFMEGFEEPLASQEEVYCL